MARKKAEEDKVDTGRWLATYADMMNNLLVLFMVLYAMSILDLNKFRAMAKGFSQALGGPSQPVEAAGSSNNTETNTVVIPDSTDKTETTEQTQNAGETEEPQDPKAEFDELYDSVKKSLAEKGYADTVDVEKGEDFIYFRFKESVLFYPDSPSMKSEGSSILEYVGLTLKSVSKLIESIDIGGHTAQVGKDSTTNFFAWELSSDRAITVLKFFVQKCSLSQSIMTIAGYSHYKPVSTNNTEEGRSANRRVEIKVSRIPTKEEAASQSAADTVTEVIT